MTTDIIQIPLTHGQHTVINASDRFIVAGRQWYAMPRRDRWIAAANEGDGVVQMHRLIMGASDPSMQVDHRDGDTLNNRRDNLRIATQSQNMRNRPGHSGTSSRFRGVYMSRGKWRANLRKDGKVVYIGTFATEEEAARAYDDAALEVAGEFAWLNFPPDGWRQHEHERAA